MWNFFLHFPFIVFLWCCGGGAWSCCQLDKCDYFTFACLYFEIRVSKIGFSVMVWLYFFPVIAYVLYLKFYGSVLVCTFDCLIYMMSINIIVGSISICVVCLQFWFFSVVLMECICFSNLVENILLLDPTKN
jgi:hypothetical protein